MFTPDSRASLRILLVDDEPDVHLATAEVLREAGHVVDLAYDGQEALHLITGAEYDVMLCDVRLPGLDGLSLFRKARALRPDLVVILATGFTEIHDAIAAMKEGAFDYLTKPLDSDEIVLRMARLAEQAGLRRQLVEARTALAGLDASETIVGHSAVMCRLRDRLNTIAGSDAPVLLTGETGTGKELVARALHERGSAARAARSSPSTAPRFPDSLIEAELFGHERGAFTGAVDAARRALPSRRTAARCCSTRSATCRRRLQAKLLRVAAGAHVRAASAATRRFRSTCGSSRPPTATCRQRMDDGRFREDLYYRLNVLSIDVPPLRDRAGDLPLLVQHFLQKFRRPNADVSQVTLASWAALAAFPFPGNIRQLGHAIERGMVLAGGGAIDVAHLPREMTVNPESAKVVSDEMLPLRIATKEFERQFLKRRLAEHDGRRTAAAETLGISRKNLWEKLRSHGDIAEPSAS